MVRLRRDARGGSCLEMDRGFVDAAGDVLYRIAGTKAPLAAVIVNCPENVSVWVKGVAQPIRMKSPPLP